MKSLRGSCYLGVCGPGLKQKIKRALLGVEGVYRITDHGGHIKINTTKPLPPVRGLRTILVKDRTTHWDAEYWDFAMSVFRRATTKHQRPEKAFGVMVHYLCNLFGLPEVEVLNMLAAQRVFIDATWTDERAHGWELKELAKLKSQERTKALLAPGSRSPKR